jgi:hypothetical protein
MAEGMLGGVLGEEEEKPEVESHEALASAEAFAAAVAAIASRQDPQVARDTSAFLKEQTELIRVQEEDLKDEHQARLHFLRGQAREVDIRRFGLRLKSSNGCRFHIRWNLHLATEPEIAQFQALLHDPAAAEINLQTTKPDLSDPTIAAGIHWVRGRLASDSRDPARAVSEMEAFLAAYSNPAVVWGWPGFHCWVAPAEEAAGHPDKADAVLKAAGTFVDCYRFTAISSMVEATGRVRRSGMPKQ